MIYIENEGAIFRGVDRGLPTEVFRPSIGKFAPYKGSIPKPVEWGHEISEEEARRLMGVAST